jgi:small subunit ribosomal protein S16
LLVIRLQRTGRQNLATYRVVVAEKSKAVKKECVEILGHYLPTQNPKVLEVNLEKVQEWIKKGAQPSETVASLLKSLGAKDMDKYLSKPNRQAKRKKALPEPAPVAAPAAAAEPATTTEETPAEAA